MAGEPLSQIDVGFWTIAADSSDSDDSSDSADSSFRRPSLSVKPPKRLVFGILGDIQLAPRQPLSSPGTAEPLEHVFRSFGSLSFESPAVPDAGFDSFLWGPPSMGKSNEPSLNLKCSL